MSKPTLVTDVRSVLRRSLPEPNARVIDFDTARPFENVAPFPQLPDNSMVYRSREVMNSLQAATALSRLFPGTPLIVLAVPENPAKDLPMDVAPLPMREISTRPERSADLAAIIRSSFSDEFEDSVPAVAEALLGELGVIERQDRSYYVAENHDDDAMAAYNYRQRRRKDILSELLELKRGSN
jgi:hypothetical protein